MLVATRRVGVLAALSLMAPGSALWGQFTASGAVPSEGSYSENADFADVDLDGDFDVAFADGGDQGNDQNRIWINMGGLQLGVEGQFVDETATRFPVFSDQSRDVEFADIDADGDVDLHISNTASFSNQGNRWWVNQGGEQAGTLGFYADETAARWVGLGEAGSTIHSSLLLPNALDPVTFIDWSHDSDFADLDNDGDLDLVHSSYGAGFSGGVPTRLFLNDGGGFFTEHNPGGYDPNDPFIAGADEIWCEGQYQPNTEKFDGTECDIATNGIDVELGDINGDLDIDLLLGSRDEDPRMFENRLEETGGLLYRDVTWGVFPPNWAPGNGHFEQEFGDLDNDDDLDIFGLNWASGGFGGFNDATLLNDSGTFSAPTTLPSSSADDEEGDFVDYDQDGDLDIFVANFSGSNRLYRNQLTETGSVSYVLQASGFEGGTSKDVDAADVDGDGDSDLILVNSNFGQNELLVNTTNVADTTSARMSSLEVHAGGAATAGVLPLRVAVYDNAPYYDQYFNDTRLLVDVDGIHLPAFAMQSSGGQIFRGELPANLVGDVDYLATSSDRMGNAGFSGVLSFTNTGDTGTVDGSTSSSSVGTPSLRSLVEPIAGSPVYLVAENVAAGTLGFLLASESSLLSLDLGDGLVLNVGVPVVDLIALAANGDGESLVVVPSTKPGLMGATVFLQYFGLDGVGGANWASSNRLTLTFG